LSQASNSSISNAARISIGLTLLTLVIFCGAQWLGLIQSGEQARLKERLRVSETMAVQLSDLVQRGDADGIKNVASQLLGHVQGLQSIGIRHLGDTQTADTQASNTQASNTQASNTQAADTTTGATLLFASADHPPDWSTKKDKARKHVEVPIYDGQTLWGRLEIVWTSDIRRGVFQLPDIVGLAIFVSMSSLFCFIIYMRRTLRAVDPSAVVPERVRSMLDTLTESAVLIDNGGQIVLANLAFGNLVGEQNAGKLTGKLLSNYEWKDASGNRPDPMPWMLTAKGETQRGLRLQFGDGENPRVLVVNATPIQGENKSVRGALVTLNDVTAIQSKNDELELTVRQLHDAQERVKKQNEELQWLATRDGLTGCLNRRAFQEQLKTLYELARRYDQPLSVVMFDIDHFKSINDQHGHSKGDDVLREIAKRLQASVRSSDVVCRYGGEEFSLLLPKTDTAGAISVAETVRKAVAAELLAGLKVTASLGVSTTTLCGATDTEHVLLNQADEALYLSKHEGRNRVSDFTQVVTPGQLPKKKKQDAARVAHQVTLDALSDSGSGNTDTTQLEAAKIEAAKVEADRIDAAKIDAAGIEAAGIEAAGIEFAGSDAAANATLANEIIPASTIAALTSALAYRDAPTAAHSRRIAQYCVAALQDVVSIRDACIMEAAALLHDNGKIGVPDAILLKPGELTDDEWLVMEQHDRIGTEIIGSAFECGELTAIVQNHHAYFDGTDESFGETKYLRIPLRARLLSIADAYDAMTSDRPYRKALSTEFAFKELRKCAGKQFDPNLVELLIRAIDPAAAINFDLETTKLYVERGIFAERISDALNNSNRIALCELLMPIPVGIELIDHARNELAKLVESQASHIKRAA